ncbi:sugar kinase [Halogeometricum pallidum JCM 14848]|uniref:Sugar kinase n=1 Tax=Halogeometricum pallidum JCM 14848 TaxID=1227487 RepID=M0DBU6_HALPD|nr:PfkB family carbohydrate kinase [Halogeometricum pallidum]ELZ32936.1 sugar kinase [Halogeometricum pallidum JCM 14848]
MPRVVCAGHVNWDVTLRVDSLPDPDGEAAVESRVAAAGGSAANVAGGLADLGVDCSLLGSVGGDEYGRAARAESSERGVDCDALVTVPDDETTRKYVVVDPSGEVMVLGCPGANEAFEAADLPEGVLRDADHLHLTGQRPETAAQLAERASEAGVPVSFDPGRRVGERAYEATLSTVDYLFLNDREAALAFPFDASDSDGRTLVLKRGPDGAEVRTGGERIAHPGYPVDAVDTTGAGDAFAAGFLAGAVAGESHERALAVANACGALAARVPGARTDLSRAAVDALLGA